MKNYSFLELKIIESACMSNIANARESLAVFKKHKNRRIQIYIRLDIWRNIRRLKNAQAELSRRRKNGEI